MAWEKAPCVKGLASLLESPAIQLATWLDKLHYEKLIHPYSIDELRKYRNPQMQSLYDAKIDAYTDMRCIAPQTAEFTALLSDTPKTANDQIDNQLLCELYCKRADILITEDRRMRLKADRLGLSERVFTINSFIIWETRHIAMHCKKCIFPSRINGICVQVTCLLFTERGQWQEEKRMNLWSVQFVLLTK